MDINENNNVATPIIKDNEASNSFDSEESFSLLPLRDIVVFPHMIVPLFVGREKSIRALDHILSENKQLFLVSQKDPTIDNPNIQDLNEVGTLATVLQLLRLPDGTIKILVEGGRRAQIKSITQEEPFFCVKLTPYEDKEDVNKELLALTRSVMNQFEQYVQLNKHLPPEVLVSVSQITNSADLADVIASHISLKLSEKQNLLECTNLSKRLEMIFTFMESEIGALQVEKKIRHRIKRQMEKSQKEYYLNEQMKAIQKELGDGEEGCDIANLQEKIKKAHLPKEAKERATSELKKLRMLGPMSAEASIVRTYLDWILALPWNTKEQKEEIDLIKAKEILDADHFGLEKVKERIIEFLAVQKKSHENKAPILCLVGPPGVGKTSLGQSIAKATNRHFVRASLGGMRDEAEIRGHRRTYIGAMPGKIIQSMKKSKTLNTLFLLDEIDKVGADWRGDPSSALLEVLDPEQNKTFNDHYLEIDYDLSKIMFVTTANTLKMSRPLLDRMEVIKLEGYTEDEKVQIALKYLLPKQMKETSLSANEFSVSEQAIRSLIRLYTRESGVRNLEREIANLARKAVKEIMVDQREKIDITADNLEQFAGIPRYSFGVAEKKDQIGITTGLAWTEVGGEILSIEAVTMPGKGNIILTGQLGDVMKESIEAARSYIRSRHVNIGIPSSVFEKSDIHVHVPEGATPKDGPSAGIAMCTSLVSALTGIPIHKDIAMTGEITLRGKVLPIGGLKEKLLAALRGGLKTVLIPAENEKDLTEIPKNVKDGLKIITVSQIEEVLSYALTKKLSPIVEEEKTILPILDTEKRTSFPI